MAIGSPTEQITKKPPLLMDPVPFSIPELTIRGENGWEMQLLGRTERVGGGGGEVWGVGGGVGGAGFSEPHFPTSLSPYPPFTSVLPTSSPTQEEPIHTGAFSRHSGLVSVDRAESF